MTKREELILKYASELKEKFNDEANIELLTKVTIDLGPSIYNPDSSKIAANSDTELNTVKQNFLIKKLGLEETIELDIAIDSVLEKYGKSNPTKYRAVVYYLLTKYFEKEEVYLKKGTGPR